MTDVVVIGTGIAGLSAALSAAEAGARVTVVTKAALGHTATDRAQGGMAAMTSCLPGGQPKDSVHCHVQDTMSAGAGLCDAPVVHGVVTDSADAVRCLAKRGVAFDRAAAPGTPWAQGLEAAHSVARILHVAGDATGHAIQEALSQRLRDAVAAGSIRILEYTVVTSVVTGDHRAIGAVLRSVLKHGGLGSERFLAADHVVLATGGAGQLYPYTTNPEVATGDGVALALRAGAQVRDLEFFQFHPTALAAPGSFLISEAVRGAGAVLRDQHGHRFMADLDHRAELAPRDVVARAVFTVRTAVPDGAAYLDCTTIPVPAGVTRAEFLARRFPTIDAKLKAHGIAWSEEWVPVSPAAHYHMGGIVTDELGRSTVPGLWAAGECAGTGMHGANRLASNSLLEAAVIGDRVGRLVARRGPDAQCWPTPCEAGVESRGLAPGADNTCLVAADGLRPVGAHQHPSVDASAPGFPASTEPFSRTALHRHLWRDAGVFRTAQGLERVKATLQGWLTTSAEAPVPDTLQAHEDRSLLTVGHALVTAALARTESRGAHQRADFPTADDAQATSVRWSAQPSAVATHERTVHADSLGR